MYGVFKILSHVCLSLAMSVNLVICWDTSVWRWNTKLLQGNYIPNPSTQDDKLIQLSVWKSSLSSFIHFVPITVCAMPWSNIIERGRRESWIESAERLIDLPDASFLFSKPKEMHPCWGSEQEIEIGYIWITWNVSSLSKQFSISHFTTARPKNMHVWL